MNKANSFVADSLDFLRDGGEMGARIRSHDWDSTPLGSPGSWPLPLRTAVRIMLTTNHPVFIFWGEELICLYNDAYSRSLGPDKHPAILAINGRDAWPEIWDIIGPQIEYVMSGQGATWHENHLVPINRHGMPEDVYWTYSYSPIDDQTAASGVGGILVLCTETTEQVFAAARLKAAEERWRLLFEQTPGFVCVLSGPEHVFEFANPAYFALVRNRDILGKRVADALPWTAEQGFVRILDETYASGVPFAAYSTPVQINSGPGGEITEACVDFVYQPIKNELGEVTGIFVQGSDVTQRWQAEKALKLADQRKDDFLATLAHELRNPLAPIQTGIEVLKFSRRDSSRVDEALGIMERQLSHMVRLVDDLLDISRISLGKITLRPEKVNLCAALLKAVEASSAAIYKDDRKVKIELPEEPLFVSGDMVRLVQVMSNLLNNAGKHALADGNIWLSISQQGRQAVISVRDDGVGIAPGMLDKLFEMFMQVHPDGGSGLGIGLALVRKLVELHGGVVRARSAGLGKGSEFVVRLPLLPEEDLPEDTHSRLPEDTHSDLPEDIHSRDLPEDIHSPEDTHSSSSPEDTHPVTWSNLAGKRIMVVDDNQDAAETMEILISMAGAQVRRAHDGNSALALVEGFAPHVILLDLGMPDIDGYEVARRIREQQSNARVVLVALTGWGQDEVRQKVMETGFDHHLVKPVSLQDLESVLQ